MQHTSRCLLGQAMNHLLVDFWRFLMARMLRYKLWNLKTQFSTCFYLKNIKKKNITRPSVNPFKIKKKISYNHPRKPKSN
jgi:hypothetical protein